MMYQKTMIYSGNDHASNEKALAAIDILVMYKSTVHDFTQEIVDFWELPKLIMQRYQFENPEQLNDLLESIQTRHDFS